jgi:hypothetical protein
MSVTIYELMWHNIPEDESSAALLLKPPKLALGLKECLPE